jgi:hypothetical protein
VEGSKPVGLGSSSALGKAAGGGGGSSSSSSSSTGTAAIAQRLTGEEIKHCLYSIGDNNTFLTAYAHNQTLLVKEDQAVRRGQKIAEMGSSDADRVKLHFEIRRLGRPVDPARFLPGR